MSTNLITTHDNPLLTVTQANERKADCLRSDLLPGEHPTRKLTQRSLAYFDRGIITALNQFSITQLKAPYGSLSHHQIQATVLKHLSDKTEDTLALQLSIDDLTNTPDIISIRLNDPRAIGLDNLEPKGNFIWIKITPTSVNCFLDNFSAPDSPLADGSSFKGYMAFKFTWVIMRLFRKEGMFIGDGAIQLCQCDSTQNTAIDIRNLKQECWYKRQGARHVETRRLFEEAADCAGISSEDIDTITKEHSTISHESYEAAKMFFRTATAGQLYTAFTSLSEKFNKAKAMVECLDQIKAVLGQDYKDTTSLHDFISELQKNPTCHELFHEFTNRIFRNQYTFLLELMHSGRIGNTVFNTFTLHQLAKVLIFINSPYFPQMGKTEAFEILLETASNPACVSENYMHDYSELLKQVENAFFKHCIERGKTQNANAKVNSSTTLEKIELITKNTIRLDLEIDMEHFIPAIQATVKNIEKSQSNNEPLRLEKLKELNQQLFSEISKRFCHLAQSIDNQDTYTFYEMLLYARFVLDASNVFKTEIGKQDSP